jgi:histidine triad (HIT) family protein
MDKPDWCCDQVLTNLSDEQHNRHLHLHVSAGDGVARFVARD